MAGPVLAYEGGNRRRRVGSVVLRALVLSAGLTVLAWGCVQLFAIRLPGGGAWFGGDWAPVLAGTPLAPMNFSDEHVHFAIPDGECGEHIYYALAGVFLGLVLVAQWLFLLPRGSWRVRAGAEPRPMRRAAVVAGAVAMLLTTGLIATVLDFRDCWGRMVLVATRSDSYEDFRLVWAAMLAVWGVWAVVFWRYFGTLDGYTGLSRAYRWLLAGTVLELLVAAPAQALGSSSEKCYCARGSYTGLVFGGTCALWLFGPGLYLLFLRERRRRERAGEAV